MKIQRKSIKNHENPEKIDGKLDNPKKIEGKALKSKEKH